MILIKKAVESLAGQIGNVLHQFFLSVLTVYELVSNVGKNNSFPRCVRIPGRIGKSMMEAMSSYPGQRRALGRKHSDYG